MAIVDELVAVLGYEIDGQEQLKKYERSLSNITKKVGNFANAAGKAAGAAGVVMAGGFALLGRSVINTTAEFEGYAAALKTIEGSAEKAQQSLDWISDFGKTTPYEVGEVTEAFVALKAYGIDPIANDALRTLGDTASAMNKPLKQAVEAFADAATGEFERLKEFGIKAATEGDNVTFAWTKNGEAMSKTVKKNSTEIRAFLLETMGDRFAGAMDEKSKTWSGMMSNIADTWTQFQLKIGKGGLFDKLKDRLSGLLDTLATLEANGTLDEWAVKISDVFVMATDFIGSAVSAITRHIKFLSQNFENLKPYVIGLGVVIAGLVATAFPLITALSLIAVAVNDFMNYLEGGESVIGNFISYIKELLGVSDDVAETIAGIGAMIATGLTAALVTAPGLLIKGLIAAFGLLSNPVGWAIILAGIAAALVAYFWDDLAAAWETTSEKASEIFGKLADWITGMDWFASGLSIMSSIWDGMKSIGGNIKDWLLQLIPDWAKRFIDFGDNSAKAAANSTATSGRDLSGSRQSTANNTVTINQTVTKPSDAPGAVARATGNAMNSMMPGRLARIEAEPSMQ